MLTHGMCGGRREAGGITNLVGVLQQGMGDLGVDVMRAGVKTLLALTVDDTNQGSVTEAGGLPSIVKLLSCNDDVRGCSCVALHACGFACLHAHVLMRVYACGFACVLGHMHICAHACGIGAGAGAGHACSCIAPYAGIPCQRVSPPGH